MTQSTNHQCVNVQYGILTLNKDKECCLHISTKYNNKTFKPKVITIQVRTARD